MDNVSLSNVPQKWPQLQSTQFIKLCVNITVMVMKLKYFFKYFNVNRLLYGLVFLNIDALRILSE